MNYLEAKAKWDGVKDLRELSVFEYEIIITAFLENIAQLEAAQHSVQRTCSNCGGPVNVSTGYIICERGCGGPVASR